MLMKDCLKKYSIKIMQLGIKNKLLFHPAKLNNILDINLSKLSVDDITNDDNLGIYYVKYDNNIFYLVIDNIKGYFEKTDGDHYLTIIFDNEKYEKIFKSIWDKIKKNKFNEYTKDYNIIRFKSDDVLKYSSTVNINTMTIIIRSVFKSDCCYYPQIYLDSCLYNYRNE